MDVALVRTGNVLLPHSQEDAAAIRGFEEGAVLRARLTGVKRQRSYQQLKLFWACCRKVAENADDENWNRPEKVAEMIKLALGHVKARLVQPSGEVVVITGSLAFDALPHPDACRFFEDSWEILAAKLDCTVEELLSETADSPEQIAAAYGI